MKINLLDLFFNIYATVLGYMGNIRNVQFKPLVTDFSGFFKILRIFEVKGNFEGKN